ncbi:MAG: hypothetical protein ACJ76H_02840 [Bacteriovoracaceae bacterium]
MNSREAKGSTELKNEVLQELRQVNSDISRMQGRMTPGQIVDDALLRPGANPRMVFDHLKANPIGTALLGLGTLLLMEDETHVTYETRLRGETQIAMNKARTQVGVAKTKITDVNQKLQGVADKVQDATQRATDKVHNVQGKIQGAIDRTKGKVDELTHQTGENDLGDGGELGMSSIDDIKYGIGELKGEVAEKTESFSSTVKELDPMTFIAIGAGLGALTGISLPVSEKEQTLVDQQLGGKLSTISSEFQDAINESVKVLKGGILDRFANFDIDLFKNKNSGSSANVNETFRGQ